VAATHAIDLGGAPTLVLAYGGAAPACSLQNAGPIALVGSSSGLAVAGGSAGSTSRFDHADLRAARLPRPLVELRPRVAVVLGGGAEAHALDLLAAARLGARTFHLLDASGELLTSNARGALALGARRSARRCLARLPGAGVLGDTLGLELAPPKPSLDATVRATELAVLSAPGTPRLPERLRVAHWIEQLGPGGAERQLTYLAAGSRARGHHVRVFTRGLPRPEEAHHVARLQAAGVPWLELPAWTGVRLPRSRVAAGSPLGRRLTSHFAAPRLLALVDALSEDPPDVLHTWLDEGNVVGGLAGLICDVPRVVLATRNVSPRRMPRLDRSYLREAYRALASSPRVRLLANSRAGAADYADWLGLPEAAFRVVPNGLATGQPSPHDAETRRAVRTRLGIDPGAFLVVGVFRLASEKAPRDFVAALAAARERVPHLRAVHVGAGPLAREAHREARALEGALQFAGRVPDSGTILGAADVCLLTSLQEGCPNVLLEAQACGVPVVATRAGGTAEACAEGTTALLAEPGDTALLGRHLVTLAGDPGLRQRLGAAGPGFVAARFSCAGMVEATLAAYR
jgi:glycosyltransferase involved in cell wall biosynthesis